MHTRTDGGPGGLGVCVLKDNPENGGKRKGGTIRYRGERENTRQDPGAGRGGEWRQHKDTRIRKKKKLKRSGRENGKTLIVQRPPRNLK